LATLTKQNNKPLADVSPSFGMVDPKSKYPVVPFPCTNPELWVTPKTKVPLAIVIMSIALGAAAAQIGRYTRRSDEIQPCDLPVLKKASIALRCVLVTVAPAVSTALM
jgi:hypothetical protein